MDLLRRLLYLDALLSAVAGAAVLAVPRFVLVTILGQPPWPDYAFVRLAGVAWLALAMTMVLVANDADRLWWWSWAFVAEAAGAGAVLTLHAAFGLPRGAAAWPWWALALLSWVLASALLLGLTRTARRHPPL